MKIRSEPVVYRLRGNDGGRRQIAVVSDAAGRAESHFTLGGRAGVANQVVEASAAGFAGPAVFTASARPGEPAMIVVDSGGLQVGVAGRRVPRPLIAAVVDSGNRRLGGVLVLCRVVKGQGAFAGGSQESVLATDSDGRAVVAFTLDPEEGVANNVVQALLQDAPDVSPATFAASGRAAGDPAATSISGVVLDNTSVPLEGVTARVKGTALTAVSDAEGQFRIDGAPVGSVKLIVDGSTVNRPGSWPDLEFDLVTIPGRNNTVNMPIYLLPLDLGNGLYVDETQGGTLALP
ncbi:MAG: carboxypeptidase-like regulatory domain-containing protein, partial [bacterium]|nr:carboxypeptidase-like regulatory domain-containing protein [bacterium]